MNLKISLLRDKYAVCRLNRNERIPEWAYRGDFFSITRTDDELSLVCLQENVDLEDFGEDAECEKEWRIFKVEGPLDFSLVGILANLSCIMKEAGVSIFAVSTYDTDYIMVKEEKVKEAVNALKEYGHEVVE
ncbi:hypothetical protein SAMN02745751_02197 [Dethiosulfatibacter aminovorans DSM 17477]|uniref:Uncharacterized protein n=1 Tax=Dethiosulfatibacter aminovorans DSM 17477 TaxID=1121476 RepID=A0A1M6I305_9FIRM|nr:ACT domain-containing protein [Dethiosulfatibacter aminovorans]SHJ28826.1 hypothetical protein SAMN02745751_02197 [Dethiosulfatibacter aminovorans DSM 17477]